MTVNVLKVVAVALASLSSRASAFSTGVGSCGAGDASINNAVAGNAHVASANGPLADAGVTFSVNGAALTAGSTTTVTVGSGLEWSVDASGTGYKGILVRIESAGDFTLVGDPAFVDAAALCASIANVQGVDHFNQNLKTSVTGSTVFDAAGTATVDVVVVFSLTQWAYSSFPLTIEATAGTPAPVDGTTPAPVDGTTPAPVDGTTPAPVDVPTDTTPAPTPPIDSTPAPTPVAVPSPVTDAPTDDTVPTADGECPEGKGKGKKDKGDDSTGKGMGMGMKSGKMMKCKKEKTPKEPKTPKAGKGGKGKGDEDEAAVRRRK